MQNIATPWLVYRITESAFLLGVAGFASQILTLVFAPLAGVWVDRWDRRKVILVTQTLSAIPPFLLAALALTGKIEFWHILVLSGSTGLIAAFDIPARQSFAVEMVGGREDLSSAIALNSAMVNGARLIGPSVAGIVIALWGEGICFLVNGVSYFAILLALFMMRVPPRSPTGGGVKAFASLTEGVKYVRQSPSILTVLVLLGVVGLMGNPYTVLLPVFASQVLGGGPRTLGFLAAFTGLGALAGAGYLASRRNVLGLGRVVLAATTLFAVGLAVFSRSSVPWLAMILITVVGFGFMLNMAGSNTLIQTLVDDDKRGRVMSLFVVARMGTAPFGNLFAGAVAAWMGVPNTMLLLGGLVLLGCMYFARQMPIMRTHAIPIYQKRGIVAPPTGEPYF